VTAAKPRNGHAEVLAVWGLFGLAVIAVFITYWRIPAAELYNTSVEGLAGGAGRALGIVNYPVALAAVAIVLVCADRLAAPGARHVVPLAAAAIALCLVIVVPGVVDQGDLDASPVNVLPALGVAMSLGLTIWSRPRSWAPRAPGDRLRLALAAVLGVLSVPWLFAETGFYAPDPIYADERPAVETGETTLAAVHLGFHHGMGGVELALAALLLSRTLPGFGHDRLRSVAAGYLSLMLVYGCANAVQDAWGEQVVKRGWTDSGIPSLIRPGLSLWWALIVACSALVWLLWFRPPGRAVGSVA
jgi:hypothetical protein